MPFCVGRASGLTHLNRETQGGSILGPPCVLKTIMSSQDVISLEKRAAQLNIAEAVLSFVGACIAGTLWWAHRTHTDLPCTSGGGCDVVAASRWANITLGPLHHIPVALLGLIGYIVLMSLSMLKMSVEKETVISRLHSLLWAISAGGIGYSWFLQYVAHFKLAAFCIYCFSSACVMTLLFLTATVEAILLRRLSLQGASSHAGLGHATQT